MSDDKATTKAPATKKAASKPKPKAQPKKAEKPVTQGRKEMTDKEREAFNSQRRMDQSLKERVDRKPTAHDVSVKDAAERLTKATGHHVGGSAVQNHLILGPRMGYLDADDTFRSSVDNKRYLTAKGYKKLEARLTKGATKK